jgi:hypothetical protein
MIVGSGFPASDLSENNSACSRTPSLVTLAARKSMLSGALNWAAVTGANLAGSGGRVEDGCVGVCWDDCCAIAALPEASVTAQAMLMMNLTTDLAPSKIHLLENWRLLPRCDGFAKLFLLY